ncbi:MAG: GNAT N-acetyltransferase [Mycobacteriaceae bacterium]|nr:GNAT N-acetyltransferase [Mycobacteriaceae bacterium]
MRPPQGGASILEGLLVPAPVTLIGRAVRLEPLASHHAPALAEAAAANRDTYAFTPVPHGENETREYIAAAAADQAAGTALPFAIVTAAGRVVGASRFMKLAYWQGPLVWGANTGVPPSDPGDAVPDAAEIGNTWLAADAQGSGINAEAKLLMLRHAFEVWGVRRVSMRADIRNLRSRIAIERLGATCEGIRRCHSRGLDGAVRNTAFYSVLDEEWPAVRATIEMLLPAARPLLSA